MGAVAEAVWRLVRDAAEPPPRLPGYDDLDEEELLFPMALISFVVRFVSFLFEWSD